MNLRPLINSIGLMLCLTGAAYAQDSPPNTNPELTEGLLDLLKESTAGKSSPAQDEKPTDQRRESTGAMDGEDLVQASQHPLRPVRESMIEIASRLRSADQVSQAQQQQRDVVIRLDEMIARLEQQSKNKSDNQSGKSQSSTSSAASQSNRSQSSNATRDPSRNNSSPDAAQTAGKSAATRPGDQQTDQAKSRNSESTGKEGQTGQSQAGESQPGTSSLGNRKAVIDLTDPTALQRSAWGNLPDRTRQQMQSRMVERFLPSYREEIEAYYRALAK